MILLCKCLSLFFCFIMYSAYYLFYVGYFNFLLIPSCRPDFSHFPPFPGGFPVVGLPASPCLWIRPDRARVAGQPGAAGNPPHAATDLAAHLQRTWHQEVHPIPSHPNTVFYRYKGCTYREIGAAPAHGAGINDAPISIATPFCRKLNADEFFFKYLSVAEKKN